MTFLSSGVPPSHISFSNFTSNLGKYEKVWGERCIFMVGRQYFMPFPFSSSRSRVILI